MQPHGLKDALRRTITKQRGAVSGPDWAAEDAARTRLLLEAMGEIPGTVALYASRPGEPGTDEAITQLHASGWQVLLPRLGSSPGWAQFKDWEDMRPGWGGIPEPMVHDDGDVALDLADVVVVACLAVARDGTRLGTGGGWYDRALPRRRPGMPVWALARTRELLPVLPAEPHDVPVDVVFTPDGIHPRDKASKPGIGQRWPGQLS